MTDVSMVGLGRMGAAIAQGLLAGDHQTTVWNRDPEKMQSFVDGGAKGASSVAEAVAASPVAVVCIDGYDATRALLGTAAMRDILSGRIVVQLSTVTPDEATESERWFGSVGAHYLDGAILAGPQSLRTEDAQILFAGPKDTFARAEPVLLSTCPTIRYLGSNIRAAAVLDMAWLCRHYGTFAGVTHGALLCENERVPLDLYAEMFSQRDHAHWYAKKMHEGTFDDTPATLRVWAGALEAIRRHSANVGINSETPAFFARQFERALKAGYGEEDVAALLKALRDS